MNIFVFDSSFCLETQPYFFRTKTAWRIMCAGILKRTEYLFQAIRIRFTCIIRIHILHISWFFLNYLNTYCEWLFSNSFEQVFRVRNVSILYKLPDWQRVVPEWSWTTIILRTLSSWERFAFISTQKADDDLLSSEAKLLEFQSA